MNTAERRIQKLAKFLDSSIRLPGGFRIGADSIIGLVPGIGDAIGAIFSSYIIFEAAKLGVPKVVLFKMIKNVLLETVVGIIPVVGDIFDMAFKANIRNVKLIENISDSNKLNQRSTKKIFSVIAIFFVIFLALFIWIIIKLLVFITDKLNHLYS